MDINEQYSPAGDAHWPGLPVTQAEPHQRLPTICIATPDIYGPIKNGGIGSAFYGLAQTLRDIGHDVSVVFQLGPQAEDGRFAHWAEYYRERGISLVPLPETPGTGRFPLVLQRSWATYRWLLEHPFDVTFFADWSGLGYYSLLAKRCRLAFADAVLVTNTHAPTFWARLGNKRLIDDSEYLLLDHLERKSVAWADAVVSPSQHLLHWMRLNGWTLPERTYVQANCLANEFNAPTTTEAPAPATLAEWVFFGRLEPRKGLIEFCDALTQLSAELSTHQVSITFLGKSLDDESTFHSRQFINGYADKWAFEWQIIDSYDSAAALEYLRGPGRVAMIPSLIDNSPMTILECLNCGIPFAASNVGGIPELIAEDDHAGCLFRPFVPDMVAFMRAQMGGVPIVPRRHCGESSNRAAWANWLARKPPVQDTAPAIESKSAVTVVILHYNRPELLSRLLESLRRQDYPDFNVLVADDGSDDARAVEFLDSLEPDFTARGWRILRLPHRYKGHARNAAARAADGEYILFLDDDNYLVDGAITTWVRAAAATGADILPSVQYAFDDDSDPFAADFRPDLILHVGAALAYGSVKNIYGDMNCLFRRQSFLDIGGVNERYGYGHEDWELFARAALAGLEVMVVPEPLVWYQRERDKYVRLRYKLSGFYLNNIGPYLDRLSHEERGIILLAQGLEYESKRLARELERTLETLGEIEERHRLDKLAALMDKELRVREEYEKSTSWRLSAPVRYVRAFIEKLRSG